ncbi:unnamed protein product [Boreogadus saida]
MASSVKEEVQTVVNSVTSEFNREQLWLANESLRMEYLRQQEPHIVRLQACLKGYKQRKLYKDRLAVLQGNVGSVVKLQSIVKMWKARRKYTQRLQYFREHEKEIVKIQAFLKANKAREDYRTLTGAQDPPLSVVRKFVHLLEAEQP